MTEEIDYKELLRKILTLVNEDEEFDFPFMAERFGSFSPDEIQALKDLFKPK